MSRELSELGPRAMARAREEVKRLALPPQPRPRRVSLLQKNIRASPEGGRWRPAIPPKYVKIATQIEAAHGLKPGDLYLDCRVPWLIEIRREAFVALRAAGLSYPDIGFMFGMHHTTVLHHVKKAAARVK